MSQPNILKVPKPPEVFLIAIKITATRRKDARRFAQAIAEVTEEMFNDAITARNMAPITYDLNLSKWEPI